jgi:hypothetical protein
VGSIVRGTGSAMESGASYVTDPKAGSVRDNLEAVGSLFKNKTGATPITLEEVGATIGNMPRPSGSMMPTDVKSFFGPVFRSGGGSHPSSRTYTTYGTSNWTRNRR